LVTKTNQINRADILLAQKTKDIDFHYWWTYSHFLDKPVIEKNLEGKEVLINQVDVMV
jgi:5'-nucleotidase